MINRICALMLGLLLMSLVTTQAVAGSGRGDTTPEEIGEVERRLSEMGYWTRAVDARTDEVSHYALLAFQRVERRKQTGEVNPAEIEAIKTASRPKPIETGYAHVEVDLSRQVLFVVDAAGTISMVLPISSGSGKLFTSEGRTRKAVTPVGKFRVSHKIKGWRKSPLGLLYYPNYLVQGVAIHGSPQVPNYPASHGCVRIPMAAAKQLSEVTPVGTIVIVHRGAVERPQGAVIAST